MTNSNASVTTANLAANCYGAGKCLGARQTVILRQMLGAKVPMHLAQISELNGNPMFATVEALIARKLVRRNQNKSFGLTMRGREIAEKVASVNVLQSDIGLVYSAAPTIRAVKRSKKK